MIQKISLKIYIGHARYHHRYLTNYPVTNRGLDWSTASS